MPKQIPIDMAEALIRSVQKRECLYNSRCAAYKNRNVSEVAWRAVADEMHRDVSLCKSMWSTLRCTFNRNMSYIKNGAAKPPKWHFFKQMLFLKDYVSHGQQQTVGDLPLSLKLDLNDPDRFSTGDISPRLKTEPTTTDNTDITDTTTTTTTTTNNNDQFVVLELDVADGETADSLTNTPMSMSLVSPNPLEEVEIEEEEEKADAEAETVSVDTTAASSTTSTTAATSFTPNRPTTDHHGYAHLSSSSIAAAAAAAFGYGEKRKAADLALIADDLEDPVQQAMLDYIRSKQQCLQQQQQQQQQQPMRVEEDGDNDMHFLRGLLPFFKNLPQNKKIKFMHRVTGLLMELNDENEIESQ